MIVRSMQASDAAEVAALSEQLGYPITSERIEEKFAVLCMKPDNGFFVAEESKGVLGWVHVYGVHLLESDPYAEIGGLVVEENARQRGIGRQLMQRAEVWTVAQGYAVLRLRSGLHRTDAHAFYQRIGYELIKTAHTFRKTLR
jgi:GNAT superfamily N-acetyltransferase